ncbi:hypothetical protein [Ramlibacter rhizophilus]|uniref:DUF1705 domain-containing protein n=1 Tax=Ramlibacter rhizophilus TaxID=1781167 RepID=A0A4Z0BDF0_9BURK|nr:hypothetical protein [Ramlibacter rhizophilus]TFY96419.1 hypothetical protein EZ242_20430 [Ramlibacter rhizophilus]
MSLKLFRSTGYSTMLMPGEARLAPRPARAVVAVSAWIALACNVGLWRSAVQLDALSLALALAQSLALAGGVAALLFVLCWRRTLKPAGSLLLVLAAASAASTWLHRLPSRLLPAGPEQVFPGWAALLDWRVGTLLLVLGLLPALALWHTPLRRLTGPAQFKANLSGMAAAGALVASGLLLAWVLGR